MDGKAVQLQQGRKKVLTSKRDPVELAREFNRFGEVAVIDLDAALGRGDNLELVRKICRVADVRAGGGIRDIERGRELLKVGASCIIIGTAATPEFLKNFPKERVQVALDHRNGKILDKGWTRNTGEDIFKRAKRLAPYCRGFLCTFVEGEGCMRGLNREFAETLQKKIKKPLTIAGGIKNTEEAADFVKMGFDVQVGMSLYKGELDLAAGVVGSVDFEKSPLVPTIVQDEAGRILMLAYSNRESLGKALRKGKGIYYSRSRRKIWVKGETSGNTQELISCRLDCDRDTLLFTVRQKGPACHTGSYSCFGPKRFRMQDLFIVLKSRKKELPAGSYTTKLLKDAKLLNRKIMEEAFEVTDASGTRELAWETADVIYHMAVLCTREGLDWRMIEAELGGRSR
jgi:phosphoribosyl-ATP pyrophosphohydrolase/phosphoribosyl-AMP cyclohydrolase